MRILVVVCKHACRKQCLPREACLSARRLAHKKTAQNISTKKETNKLIENAKKSEALMSQMLVQMEKA